MAACRGRSTSSLDNMPTFPAILGTVLLLAGSAETMAAGTSAGVPADPCRRQIPPSLLDAVSNRYQNFRAPLGDDNSDDDVADDLAHGGSGCLGVATGDFLRRGHKAYALGLTSRTGPEGVVVVASFESGGWRLEQIYEIPNRARLYVKTVSPGRYEATGEAEDPEAQGRPGEIVCPRSGIIVGATEATGSVYCFVSGKWQYVVVSD